MPHLEAAAEASCWRETAAGRGKAADDSGWLKMLWLSDHGADAPEFH